MNRKSELPEPAECVWPDCPCHDIGMNCKPAPIPWYVVAGLAFAVAIGLFVLYVAWVT